MPLQQTKEQERAKQAWTDISQVKGKAYEREYGAWARKFPALVLTNGLGQALAFLCAKAGVPPKEKLHYKVLYQHFSMWVTSQVDEIGPATNDLLEKITEVDSIIYRRVTTEALAFAVWIKRFAEATLSEPKEEDND